MSMPHPEYGEDLETLPPAEGVRVLIVEDHKLFGDALRWVLQSRGMQVVGVTTSGEEALAIALGEQPELVLLDIGLPGMSGLSLGKSILQQLPETKVVALTAVAHPQTVKKAISLGFHGYVTLDIPMEQFTASLQAVLTGQVVIPRQLARASSGMFSPEEEVGRALAEQLSLREREILALLVDGLNNQQIAQRLGISQNTARAHAQRILTKLQVHSRLEAAAFAVRHSLVEPTDRDRYDLGEQL
jgi:two-component system nitrate/nitrite response regulator NarL